MADAKGAGVDPAGLRNIIGNQINPASDDVLKSFAGLAIPISNGYARTTTNSVTEVHTFKLNGVTVGVLTIIYTDSTLSTIVTADMVT